MASATPAAYDIPSGDELDDILNGIIDGEDVFDTSNIRPQSGAQENTTSAANASLGIDEEIKVVKKRQPIPKLDEDRLLSDAGIPRLQRISKDRLRFKGKGHEYSDIARLLNMYQLWLDDLYPRAKFADGLAMIETLGHRKRIQIMRKEWIDEGKPRNAAESGPEGSEEEDTAVPTEVEEMGRVSESYPELMEDVQSDARNNRNEPQGQKQHELTHQNGGLAHVPTDDGNPDEDELDALLAETEAEIPTTPKFPGPLIAPPNVDDFADADELEAMAEVEAMAETQRPR